MLCGVCEKHWRSQAAAIDGWGQAVEGALAAAVVVKINILVDGAGEAFIVTEMGLVVHLGFEGAPEAFDGAVVLTFANAGHALDDAVGAKFSGEAEGSVLDAVVAVKDGAGIGVTGDGMIEGGMDEEVVIAGTDVVGDDVAGGEIEDGGQIELFAV